MQTTAASTFVPHVPAGSQANTS